MSDGRFWFRPCRASLGMLGVTAVFLSAGLAASGEPPQRSPSIEWGWDQAKAMKLARQEGKAVLIDFWATWCGPCRDMEARLWSRPDVLRLAHKFILLRVDVDNHPEIAERYRANALPTVVLADPWGTEIARREGFKSPEVLAIFKAMPDDFAEVAPMQARLAANHRDAQALREIGVAYHRMKLFQTSTEYLERATGIGDLRSQPDSYAEVLTVIGWNSLKTGDFKKARKYFDRCMKEVPAHKALDVTVYGLFATYIASGEPQKAEPLLSRLESCCPESSLTRRARTELSSTVAGRTAPPR